MYDEISIDTWETLNNINYNLRKIKKFADGMNPQNPNELKTLKRQITHTLNMQTELCYYLHQQEEIRLQKLQDEWNRLSK